MKKPLALLACAAVALLALTGCMRSIYNVTLNPDGTASGEMIVAFEESALAGSGMTVDDVFGPDSNLTTGLSNAVVSDYSEDGYVGKRVTFENSSVDQFTVTSGEGFTREGDELIFQGSIIDEETAASLNDPTMTTGYGEPDLRLSITFPGEVSEHNGSLSGTTVTWDTEMLLSGEQAYARGSAIPGVVVSPTPSADDEATPGVDVSPTEQADETVRPKSDDDSKSDLLPWVLIGGLGAAGVGLMWYGIGKSKASAKS